MNVLGIGTDIIEIIRIEEAIKKNNTFLTRIFTDKELEYFESKNFKPQTIAGNFSAKEAISKSIGSGIRGFNFKDIEILRNDSGKPVVSVYGELKNICIEKKIQTFEVSISHCKEYAVATALSIII
ncbi:MAG: holo-ACP synthase [Clostridioides sp.]|jgi:holo-[acyl-carrier protein] synthase|nr:holo-ACP synthase [Clostridioides sp.]